MITRRTLGLLAAGAPLLAAGARAQGTLKSTTQTVAPMTQPAAPMPAPGKRAWAAQVPVIRVGLLGGENDADRLSRNEPFRKLLEDTFGVPAKVYPAADYAGVIQAFGAKQIEISEMGSSGYAGAWMDTKGGVEPLLVKIASDGSISYHSFMVTRADSGITSLDQMKGHSLAWADPNSTSGYLIPRYELKQAGYDPEPGPFFSKTGFGGGHEQAVVAVLKKQYDACCTWGSGIGDEADGFTDGNLHEMIKKGLLKPHELRILWESKPILNGPLTVRTDLPQAFRDDIKAFFLGMYSNHQDIYTQLEFGPGRGYAPVKNEDFAVFVELRRAEGTNRRG